MQKPTNNITKNNPCFYQKILINIFIVAFSGMLFVGGVTSLVNGEKTITGTQPLPNLWFLQWRMFRFAAPLHRQAFFEGETMSGETVMIEPKTIFRYRYDSGLRFDRPDVWRRESRRRGVLKYVCEQYNKANAVDKMIRVRLGRWEWPKVLGYVNQARMPGTGVRRIAQEESC